MIAHPYKYTYAHPTPISTSKCLDLFDLEIHEISHQERLAVDRTSPTTKKQLVVNTTPMSNLLFELG
jgi:hypothetical protein